jgi:hypothetical protein
MLMSRGWARPEMGRSTWWWTRPGCRCSAPVNGRRTSTVPRIGVGGWRKLRLGIDGEGYVVAAALTDSGADDAAVGVSLLEQVEAAVARFTADGAHGSRDRYEAVAAVGAADLRIVIPPKRTATVEAGAAGPWRQRNEAIERIAAVGRRQWREESGAHRQARAENGMYRYEHIVADRLRAKHLEAQQREAQIAVNVINRMTALGIPESVKVAA